MRNLRMNYSAPISEFLRQSTPEKLGVIHSNIISAETTIQQSNTWGNEVEILKDQLSRSGMQTRFTVICTILRLTELNRQFLNKLFLLDSGHHDAKDKSRDRKTTMNRKLFL